MRPGRITAALWTATLASAMTPAFAGAQEVAITAQAVAAHGEFLTQAPAPPVQGALCLVDSGVDVNPDTEPILAGRESLFGGTVDDVTSYHHGTYVAMVAGAAANGWGMVGAWPRLRVLSVRALPEGSEHLSGDAYRAGILRCVEAKTTRVADVRVVELAIGGPPAGRTTAELAQMSEAVAYARQNGIVVVSAVGNDAGPVNAPASVPGVIGVGAVGRDGVLCGFSSRGPDLDIAALGCDMDVAAIPSGAAGSGQSTSLASAYIAGAIGGLRSYRPDLTIAQTEDLLGLSAAATGTVRMVDVSAAFRAAGLSAIVDAYRPVMPVSAPPVSPAPAPRTCDRRVRVCSSPRVIRHSRRGRRVVIRLASVPKGVRVLVRVNGRRRLRTRSRTIRIQANRSQTISIRFVAPRRRPSDPVVIRPSKERR
jgi:hypothetical protein